METIQNIVADEGGYMPEVYLCTSNKRTWLIGRNIEDRPITENEWNVLKQYLNEGRTPKDWAFFLFENDIYALKSYYINSGIFFDEMPIEIGPIILNMAYNMGVNRFNPDKWPKFFKAIKNKDWKQAAIEGRDSRWFNQVGQRSKRLMNALENIK